MLLPKSQDSYSDDIHAEAEHFVQSALDALSAHIAILNDSGTIIGVNAAWRRFADENNFNDSTYGIGTNYLAVCDRAAERKSADAPQVAKGIREVITRRRDEYSLEYPCHSPTERRWFVVRVSRFDWYGETRVIVAHQNVSELKNAQLMLADSQRRLQAIFDHVSNGILTVDKSGQIESANPMAARIFGYDINDLLGLHIRDLLAETNHLGDFRQLNGNIGHEIWGRRKDGSTFPMFFAMNEIQLDNSGPNHKLYTCIILDITERKRMEAELIEKERIAVALEKERELRDLKNRFLSMMSHELRTPLSSIQLSHDMLLQYGDRASAEEKAQYLDNIRLQVEHLSEMVRDVITLSRTETEALHFKPEETDLITYCRGIFEEFYLVHHKTHQLDFVCDQRRITARIDKKLLRRALTNLLSNAIKYSPQGGQVLFRLSKTDDKVIIRIQDSGIGIPEEDQARVFEPFHRAVNVDNLPGTGLGLAIAKQSIELHSGIIHFESCVGHGTTFIIELPLSH